MRSTFVWLPAFSLLVPLSSSFVACGSESSTFDRTDSGARDGASDAIGITPFAATVVVDGSGGLGDVEALITTDNAYSFGYGDSNAIGTFVAGGPASNGPEIFNCPIGYGPEPYVVPGKDAPSNAFLYIVAWADTQTTQGTLAQFKRTGGPSVYSGSGSWQVCATGQFFDATGPGPDKGTANDFITQCNAGATGTTYSKGWVDTSGALTAGAIGKLAFGETNEDQGGSFPIVCQKDDAGTPGMEKGAKWMWFDPLDGQSPFEGNDSNLTESFLVFRLPASALRVR